MKWILVLLAYADIFATSAPSGMTSLEGFKTKEECALAGQVLSDALVRHPKQIRFVCVEQKQ